MQQNIQERTIRDTDWVLESRKQRSEQTVGLHVWGSPGLIRDPTRGHVVDWKCPPKDINILISDPCKNVPLYGSDFADVIKELGMERLSMIIYVGPKCNHM